MPMEVDMITVSERGQIVLPKKTREKLHLQKGDKLLMVEDHEKITLTKAKKVANRAADESLHVMFASEEVLKKDWNYKGDDVWDEL